MPELLPMLHEGHAPILLHQAFQDALDAYEEWPEGSLEPAVAVEGRMLKISAVFAKMQDCSDLLPDRVRDTLFALVEPTCHGELGGENVTYADGARLMRLLCAKRLIIG